MLLVGRGRGANNQRKLVKIVNYCNTRLTRHLIANRKLESVEEKTEKKNNYDLTTDFTDRQGSCPCHFMMNLTSPNSR